MKMTLALAQINTVLGDVDANLEKHLQLAKQPTRWHRLITTRHSRRCTICNSEPEIGFA